jgi:hypothetical protein
MFPTAERVRELLDYDPETGIFTRKVRLAQRHQVGSRADFIVQHGQLKGYARVGIDRQRYLAHRVAWLYVHGTWPTKYLDHINGNKSDNRICNLREATAKLNNENKHKPNAQNRAGYLGVHFHQGKWRAKIQTDGRVVDLGCYETPEKAHEIYLVAKRLVHKGCTI